MTPSKRTARLAGLLYLLVAVFGGFAQLYARGSVFVRGDAAATTANIVEHATLFRLGFVADLLTATTFILLGFVLYRLFQSVNRQVAAALVVLVAIGTGMILMNLVNHFAALLIATEPPYASMAGADRFTLLFVDLHSYGLTITGILFGLWLFPFGYLAYTSGLFPRLLGVVMMAACFLYLTDTLVVFGVPGLDETVSTILVMPTAVAELWMVGYLLTVGVRRRTTAPPVPAPA